MGRFDKVFNSTYNTSGAYFEPGNFIVRVDAVKCIMTRKEKEAFVVECTVIESDNDRFKLGSPATSFIDMTQDYAGGNIGHFIEVATGIPIKNQDNAGIEAVVSAANPLAGTILGVRGYLKRNKDGNGEHTRLEWMEEGAMRARISDLKRLAAGVVPANTNANASHGVLVQGKRPSNDNGR